MGQLKTFIWVYIIIFLVDDNFAVPQMFLAIIINPWNLHVMWKLKPLPKAHWIDLNLVELGIGLAATLIIYFKLGTTNVNKMVDPEIKIYIGWVVLILGQLKAYLGHLKLGGMLYLQHKSKVDFVKHIFMKCFCMKTGE